MAENKTKPTDASVEEYLSAIESEERRNDCRRILDLMKKTTGEAPAMWGPSIVGFGTYHYRYESGREGDFFLTGFASRKSDISVYLAVDYPEREELLSRLGRHKMGKGCLYFKRLADIDVQVLEELVRGSAAWLAQRYQ